MAVTVKRKLAPDREGNGSSELDNHYKPVVEPKGMTITYYEVITIQVYEFIPTCIFGESSYRDCRCWEWLC
jgi:hypothetical protein